MRGIRPGELSEINGYDTTPHMRGIPFILYVLEANVRYNPAHAGNPSKIKA